MRRGGSVECDSARRRGFPVEGEQTGDEEEGRRGRKEQKDKETKVEEENTELRGIKERIPSTKDE